MHRTSEIAVVATVTAIEVAAQQFIRADPASRCGQVQALGRKKAFMRHAIFGINDKGPPIHRAVGLATSSRVLERRDAPRRARGPIIGFQHGALRNSKV